jgi:Protein of unknown function (DUF4058)
MPLRDHFPPHRTRTGRWDGVHGLWPSQIVQSLFEILPPGYVSSPNIHLGQIEIDAAVLESDQAISETGDSRPYGVAVSGVITPTFVIETLPQIPDEYEIQIHDESDDSTLVAAIEIVSPSNKDRPASRRAFIAKCASLLQKNVCVTIVDVVTSKDFNLYADLLDFLGYSDPAFSSEPSPIYAATLRNRHPSARKLELWAYPLQLGQPLPVLPVWLTETLSVPLELEATYESTCRYLHIA